MGRGIGYPQSEEEILKSAIDFHMKGVWNEKQRELAIEPLRNLVSMGMEDVKKHPEKYIDCRKAIEDGWTPKSVEAYHEIEGLYGKEHEDWEMLWREIIDGTDVVKIRLLKHVPGIPPGDEVIRTVYIKNK